MKVAPADRHRLALVIGNADYVAVDPLRNPKNDARAISDMLASMGFQVHGGVNLSRREMNDSVDAFTKALRTGDIAVFYFAGHGMQVKGSNYLVPIDARFSTEADVPYNAIDAQWLLNRLLEPNPSVSIMILDACRNNPFLSTRGRPRGLASMDPPSGALIAYATAPGALASDGEGANGLYTQELLRAMQTKGQPVELVFKQVRLAVHRASRGEQTPWEAVALFDDFYFTGQDSKPVYRSDTLPLTTAPSLDTIYQSGVGRFRFGASPEDVNSLLPVPFGSVDWSTLPVAGEYKTSEVRYFWVPLSHFAGLGLPHQELYADCAAGQSNVVFLFDKLGLFRVSLRLYPDCRVGDSVIRQVGDFYRLEMKKGESTSHFRYVGPRVVFSGVADTQIPALEWVKRDAPKSQGQDW